MRIPLLVFLCLSANLAGANPLPPLSIEEATQEAIRHNPRTAAYSQDIAAASSSVKAAKALSNPVITFTPAIGGTGGSDTEFLMQQPLELNGTRKARTGAAAAELLGVKAKGVVGLCDLVFQVHTAYLELIRANEKSRIAQETLRSVEEFDRITRRQVELGARPGIEQIQSGIEVSRAKQQLTLALSDMDMARAALNTHMGRDASESIGSMSVPAPSSHQVDSRTLIAQALSNRAEISLEEASSEVLKQQVKQVAAEAIPDLLPQFRASRVTHGVQDSGIGIAISLPLLDLGSRRNHKQQLQHAQEAQRARIEAAQSLVKQEVLQAVNRVQATTEVLLNYQQGVLEQSKRLLDASKIGFAEGKTSILNLLEAQRTYRAVQSEYSNAEIDKALADASLERALGGIPARLLPVEFTSKGGRN